jgi:hypothetical protein
MGAKSKRQKKQLRSMTKLEVFRRMRLNESNNVEHPHMELLKQGERMEQLRADLDKKKKDEIQLRSLVERS